jgi:hypothetical protein
MSPSFGAVHNIILSTPFYRFIFDEAQVKITTSLVSRKAIKED